MSKSRACSLAVPSDDALILDVWVEGGERIDIEVYTIDDCGVNFINLIVIMKMIQKGVSLRVGGEGKENEPANAIQKLRSRAEGKKLGVDVK